MRQAAEYARERGVKTCSENHGYLLQDSARMLELFAAVDHPNYGFLCDMGNFTVVDEDCATAVSALSDYIVHVHAKDMLVRSGMNLTRAKAITFPEAAITGEARFSDMEMCRRSRSFPQSANPATMAMFLWSLREWSLFWRVLRSEHKICSI